MSDAFELWKKVDDVLRETMATELSGSKTDRSNDYRAHLPPPCLGCGGIAHGGVIAGNLCLQAALRCARAALDAAETELVGLRREVAPMRALRAEVAALPPCGWLARR